MEWTSTYRVDNDFDRLGLVPSTRDDDDNITNMNFISPAKPVAVATRLTLHFREARRDTMTCQTVCTNVRLKQSSLSRRRNIGHTHATIGLALSQDSCFV